LFDVDLVRVGMRRATSLDVDKVYEWQCQRETRQYALNTDVPTWDMHQLWMHKKLARYQDYFYIIECPVTLDSVGVVRLDRIKQSEYLISIFIDPVHYGKGIATQALAYIDFIHPDIMIHATVLEANVASQKLFITANYQRVAADSFVRHPII
jgi:RimJ/RimL family protein N-acetyltransferase